MLPHQASHYTLVFHCTNDLRSPLAGHLTDLFVERTMVSGIKRAFVVTTDQSCLHRWIGEANWDTRNQRRLDLLQRPSRTHSAMI